MKNTILNYVLLGKRVQQARKAKKYTQEKLAEIINISVNNISRIENATMGISLSTLVALCSALDVSADYILFGNDNGKHKNAIDILMSKLPEEKQFQAQKLLEVFVDAVSE